MYGINILSMDINSAWYSHLRPQAEKALKDFDNNPNMGSLARALRKDAKATAVEALHNMKINKKAGHYTSGGKLLEEPYVKDLENIKKMWNNGKGSSSTVLTTPNPKKGYDKYGTALTDKISHLPKTSQGIRDLHKYYQILNKGDQGDWMKGFNNLKDNFYF